MVVKEVRWGNAVMTLKEIQQFRQIVEGLRRVAQHAETTNPGNVSDKLLIIAPTSIPTRCR
jgi:hypothetical protein